MVFTFVHVWVVATVRDAFIEATQLNRVGTRQELGNHRFDLLCDDQEPTHFILLEIFADDAAVKAHRETSHYLQWRDTVAPMMAKPRQAQRMTAIDPHSPPAWIEPTTSG